MKKQLEATKRFSETFGHPVKENPSLVDKDRYLLRYKLMREENEEYLEACENDDLTEIADALGDMMYILAGTMVTHGMQDVIENIFDEIQSSNMSKLGEDGKPIYRDDGKIMKGPNYFKPDIKKFLNN